MNSRWPVRGAELLRPVAPVLAALLLLTGAFGAPAQPVHDAVSVRAVPARELVRPGAQLPVAVVLEHREGFHTWPHEPVLPPEYEDVRAVATDVRVTELPGGVKSRPVQWPEPEHVTVRYIGPPVELLSLTDTAVVYVPLEVAPDRPPGRTEIGLEVRYQACDDRICYPPQTVARTVGLEVVREGRTGDAPPARPELFSVFNWDVYRDSAAAAASTAGGPPAELNVFGWDLSFRPEGAAGLAGILLLAALGGLLLNVTPCVLPLVPIKVMGLRSASEGRGRLLANAGSMAVGMVAFWLALGAAVALVTGFGAISALFQTAWFGPLVAAVVAAAGLSLVGLFQLRVPAGLSRLDPAPGSLPGSAGFGVMTAVLATPCTAPFMAGASAWAVLQSPVVALAVFGAIGAGMALPYLGLALRPAWLERVPSSGPWSRALEECMGLLLLAVAAFFLGSSSAGGELPGLGVSHWWGVGLFTAAALVWAGVRAWQITSSTGWRAGAAAVAAGGLLAIVLAVRGLTARGPITWEPYSPEAFGDARAAGQVVVMDFTAEWCLNCKALEEGVLHRDRVVRLLERDGVVPMRVDLTDDNPEGRAKLHELGWVGIPLLAVFGPGTGYETPIEYDSYTVPMVTEAVEEAGGRPASDR